MLDFRDEILCQIDEIDPEAPYCGRSGNAHRFEYDVNEVGLCLDHCLAINEDYCSSCRRD